jgi:L-2-hydroxyglutarate oxidase LhgO
MGKLLQQNSRVGYFSTPHSENAYVWKIKRSHLGPNRLERYERPLPIRDEHRGRDRRVRDIVQETFMRLYNQEQAAIEGHRSGSSPCAATAREEFPRARTVTFAVEAAGIRAEALRRADAADGTERKERMSG